jgi:CRISPR-associated protein Cmr2
MTSEQKMSDSAVIYTAISFAPVQGFIEKSRKLRDLFGASQILSYLSQKLIEDLTRNADGQSAEVISPACIDHQRGMPNRILLKGPKIKRHDVKKSLLKHWQMLLQSCRCWIEQNLPSESYFWSQPIPGDRRGAGEWERWGLYAWEVFWGYGTTPQSAMEDLETRKLKRDWIGINWVGESSSITGTDAIAWPGLGKPDNNPGRSFSASERQDIERFYLRLAWILDDFKRCHQSFPSDQELKDHFANPDNDGGKFISPRERLSIPELAKRLVTFEPLALDIGIDHPETSFRDIYREKDYWTGWFMGDGDKVGDKLTDLANRYPDSPQKRDRNLQRFSTLMRNWGQKFAKAKELFPEGKGRVIYAGGDDFLGVLYSEEPSNSNKLPAKVQPIEAWNWLKKLPEKWQQIQADTQHELGFKLTYSVGFVWAGHQVPQRDILQHCREAEQRSKNLGRDRVTIRIVFNSGRFVQWTCPWDELAILDSYCDRNNKTGAEANWSHIYSDWAALKDRHAISLESPSNNSDIACEIFDLYFNGKAQQIFENYRQGKPGGWDTFCGDIEDPQELELAIVNWMDELIQVGWQLCRNSNP